MYGSHDLGVLGIGVVGTPKNDLLDPSLSTTVVDRLRLTRGDSSVCPVESSSSGSLNMSDVILLVQRDPVIDDSGTDCDAESVLPVFSLLSFCSTT